MLRLNINGTIVPLSDDQNFELLRDNPLFSKRGDYTYDLTLDHHLSEVAALFPGIQKIRNHYVTDNELSATLYDGNTIILKGRCIVLSYDNRKVKIQIVSGNSELAERTARYKGSIRDLDWGEIKVKTPYEQDMNLDYVFPLVHETYPMFSIQGGEKPILKNKFIGGGAFYGNHYDTNTEMVPQPFLLHYVDKLGTFLGCPFNFDAIKNEFYNRIMVCGYVKSNKYASYLPNWTLSEFIKEIEKFTNTVCVFDSDRKELSLQNVKSFYNENTNIINIDDDSVIDEFERTFEENSDVLVDYDEIEYDLPSSEYYANANISDEVMNMCRFVEKNYTILNNGEFVIYHDSKDFFWTPNGPNQLQANQFKNVKVREGNKVTMKIVPVEMQYSPNPYSTIENYGYYFIPITKEFSNEQQDVFKDVIINGVKDNSNNVLQVAIYCGKLDFNHDGSKAEYFAPQTKTCQYNIYGRYTYKLNTDEYTDHNYGVKDIDSLRLDTKYRMENHFNNDLEIDSAQIYKIKFLTNQVLDQKAIYVIRGEKFVCKTLHYNWINCKYLQYVEGEFYKYMGNT